MTGYTPRLHYTPRVRAALRLAEYAHRGQMRKGTDTPYILHPIAVALILAEADVDEDLLCAGILHDVVEDSEVTDAVIAERFGPRVAGLVAAVTEQKRRANGRAVPWKQRKEAAIAHLDEAEPDVIALKAADLAANLGDILIDYAEVGDRVWARFRKGPGRQLWYYRSVADVLLRRGLPPSLAVELQERLTQLEAVSPEEAEPSPGRS